MAQNLLHIAFVTLCLTSASAKPLVSVTKSTENGFDVRVQFPNDLTPDQAASIGLSSLDSTHLPQLSRLFAAPKNAKIHWRIKKSEFVDIQPFEWKGTSPETLASIHAAGILRGVTAFALRVYPFTYDKGERILRLYTKLDLQISFSETQKPIKTSQQNTSEMHGYFLNSEWAESFSSPRPISKLISSHEWFRSDQPWIRITVDKDGLFVINKRWLSQFTDTNSINPKKLRLFFMGEEQTLFVRGELDEKFEEEDYVLFTNKRNFGTIYSSYADVGKGIESLVDDEDNHHHDFVPNLHYSADCRIIFETLSDKEVTNRENKYKEYQTKNQIYYCVQKEV